MSCNFLGSYETSSSVFITMLQKYYPSVRVSMSSPGSHPTQLCANRVKTGLSCVHSPSSASPLGTPFSPLTAPASAAHNRWKIFVQ